MVREELVFALSLNRPGFIRPVYWEDPLPEPPQELRSFHFQKIAPMTGAADATQSAVPDSVVSVFVATTRRRTNMRKLAERFGPARGDRQETVRATVSIPPLHKAGNLESPSALRLQFSESLDSHVVITSLEDVSAEQFARQSLETGAGSETLVYVPGFNTTFEQNVRRSAVIAWDLRWRGSMVVIDWPSAGTLSSLAKDIATAEQAAPSLVPTLTRLHASGTSTRGILARDVGCRLTLVALGGARASVKELILIQPMMNREVLIEHLTRLSEWVGRTTIYVTPGTPVTSAFTRFTGPVFGHTPGESLDLPHVDVVDVAGTNPLLGLGLSRIESGVDVRGVLDGLAAATRVGLRPRAKGWQLT